MRLVLKCSKCLVGCACLCLWLWLGLCLLSPAVERWSNLLSSGVDQPKPMWMSDCFVAAASGTSLSFVRCGWTHLTIDADLERQRGKLAVDKRHRMSKIVARRMKRQCGKQG